MKSKFTFAAVVAVALATPTQAQRNFDKVEITTEEISPSVAVLFGAGGNMAVSHGDDGTILVDDQFAPLNEKITAAIAKLGAQPVDYVVNTHWHGDHTGGNEAFGKAGATIFAHRNVRVRMSTEQQRGERKIGPSPKEALPVVTFDQGVTFHLNGDTIDVAFVGGGHTDGDSVVYWREDNIVHMGDLYFKIPGYPFIDIDSGGNILSALNSINTVIGAIDDDTKVIPGHGPMSNKAELVAYRDMMAVALSRVVTLKSEGKSADETVAAKPLSDMDRGEGFISADRFVRAIYESLGAQNHAEHNHGDHSHADHSH